MGKTKDSSLLRWTQNKNNNNKHVDFKQVDTTKEKKEKKSKEEKGKKWLHRSENLTSSHIAYLVKFLGSTEVEQPKGIEVVKEGIRKLKFIQQLKKSEGTKTPKVELTISVDGLAIQEPKSKKILHQYPLHRISYCADDKAEKRFFSFIAKETDSDAHTCFVFVSDKLAEEITLTVGQAFDLAYKRFLLGKSAEPENEKIARLERENVRLRQRLMDVGSLLDKTKLEEYMKKNSIKELGLVGEKEVLDSRESIDDTHDSSKENCMEVSVDSATDTRSGRLMSFIAPVVKLDTMTLDDLNDDDFYPRTSNTRETSDNVDTFDDSNLKRTPGTSNPRTMSMSTPIIEHSSFLFPQTNPTRITTPASLPRREPSKKPVAMDQESAIPSSTQAISCPFGMNTFDNGTPQQDPFSSSIPLGNVDFSLYELDPLKKRTKFPSWENRPIYGLGYQVQC